MRSARSKVSTEISRPRWKRGDILAAALAVLITIYGGLLRFEALHGNYSQLKQPQWVRTLADYSLPLARALRPDTIAWGPHPSPFVGGDPQNYLRFAREMTSFYQAHVREPIFLALTRTYLWVTNDSDIAVAFASATGGTLAILATFLLGAAAVSRCVGLAAAAALAIEYEAIRWSIWGWRDDTFMLFVTLAAWSLVRLHSRPARGTAIAAGLASSAAMLTRLSALTFVLPALVWIVIDSPPHERRPMAKKCGVALLVCAVLVAPYLINCAIATGDPFFAVNYHTRYYRHADGLPEDNSVTAAGYLRDKIMTRPLFALDTAVTGLTAWPFFNKWGGFREWADNLGGFLRWMAAIGLVLALWFRTGRLLLVVLFASLAPYALTWSAGGGGEWRFTQHVYPLYLVAAFFTIFAAVTAAGDLVRRGGDWRPLVPKRRLKEGAVVGAMLALAAAAYSALPFLVAREVLLNGLAVNITAGDRDTWIFQGNWSRPIHDGVPVRVAQSSIVAMRVPFPEQRDYAVTFRMDPAETADLDRQPRVTVFVNRRPVTQLRMSRNPERMGTYRVRLPRELAGKDISKIEFVATHTVDASDAGPRFASLPGDTPVAFRLWYVRIEPIGTSQSRLRGDTSIVRCLRSFPAFIDGAGSPRRRDFHRCTRRIGRG